MTEQQLRQKDCGHRRGVAGVQRKRREPQKIIDVLQLPQAPGPGVRGEVHGRMVQRHLPAPWPSKAGMTDIIPTECGCEKHIELFKKLGAWQEK